MKVKLFGEIYKEEGSNKTWFDTGFMPERAHFDDAGADLRTPKSFTLKSHESIAIDLLVGIKIPVGYCGLLVNKSGLNVGENIQTDMGVIDSSYTGHIVVRLTNNGDTDHKFKRGDKVTQILFVPVGLFDFEEAYDLGESVSGRGEDGFGSTGK